MSISDYPTSYLVGSNSNQGIRYRQAEQAAQVFFDVPSVDRPFVICRSWNGQKWTSRIIASSRKGSEPVWVKMIAYLSDAEFSAAYATLKKCRSTRVGLEQGDGVMLREESLSQTIGYNTGHATKSAT